MSFRSVVSTAEVGLFLKMKMGAQQGARRDPRSGVSSGVLSVHIQSQETKRSEATTDSSG